MNAIGKLSQKQSDSPWSSLVSNPGGFQFSELCFLPRNVPHFLELSIARSLHKGRLPRPLGLGLSEPDVKICMSASTKVLIHRRSIRGALVSVVESVTISIFPKAGWFLGCITCSLSPCTLERQKKSCALWRTFRFPD